MIERYVKLADQIKKHYSAKCRIRFFGMNTIQNRQIVNLIPQQSNRKPATLVVVVSAKEVGIVVEVTAVRV